MKAKFRSGQSPTPCSTCGLLTKGQAGKFCGRIPGNYISFERTQGKVKEYETRCRFSDHKEVFIYPCISLWNPWAWAIPHALKDIENRTWAPRWKGKDLRGEILIHAAKKRMNDQDWSELQNYFDNKFKIDLPDIDLLNFGGIVGKATVVDCVTESDSPWYEKGKKGWVLKGQNPIKFIPFRGQQGIFKYHSEIKI